MGKVLVQFLSNSTRIFEKPYNLNGVCKGRFVVPYIPDYINKTLSSMSDINSNSQRSADVLSPGCLHCSSSSTIGGVNGKTNDDSQASQSCNLRLTQRCVYCVPDVSVQNSSFIVQVQQPFYTVGFQPFIFNCCPPICRQPLLCQNLVEVPFNQQRTYRRERPENYENSHKTKGKNRRTRC